MTTAQRRRPQFHAADRRPGREADRRRRRGHLRRARRPRGGLPVQARPGAHPPPDRGRPGRAPVVLDLRAHGCAAAGRRPGGAGRVLLRLPGAPGAAGRHDRGPAPVGHLHRRPVRARRPRLRRRRFGHHPGAVAGRHRAARRQVDRHRLLRQPAHQHGDVRRRAGRPEGPLRPAVAAGARALPRAPRRRTHQRPPRRGPAAGARGQPGRRRARRPLVALRPARDGRGRLGAAGGAERPEGEGAPGAVLRRRRPAPAGARRRGADHRAQQPGDRRPRRPDHDGGTPPRRGRPRLGA